MRTGISIKFPLGQWIPRDNIHIFFIRRSDCSSSWLGDIYNLNLKAFFINQITNTTRIGLDPLLDEILKGTNK